MPGTGRVVVADHPATLVADAELSIGGAILEALHHPCRFPWRLFPYRQRSQRRIVLSVLPGAATVPPAQHLIFRPQQRQPPPGIDAVTRHDLSRQTVTMPQRWRATVRPPPRIPLIDPAPRRIEGMPLHPRLGCLPSRRAPIRHAAHSQATRVDDRQCGCLVMQAVSIHGLWIAPAIKRGLLSVLTGASYLAEPKSRCNCSELTTSQS